MDSQSRRHRLEKIREVIRSPKKLTPGLEDSRRRDSRARGRTPRRDSRWRLAELYILLVLVELGIPGSPSLGSPGPSHSQSYPKTFSLCAGPEREGTTPASWLSHAVLMTRGMLVH